VRTLATLPLAALVMGCATLPEEPVARALYVDLRKAEELSSDTGWVVDRIQLESNAEDVLRSACQVDAVQRDQLDAWISGQIALHGGSAEEAYRKHGKDLGAASTLLTLERTRALLRYAQAHAGADCPFWIEPDPEFAGVQGDADRFVVLAETIGYGSAVLESDEAAIGGGGGGRLLFAHGLGPEVTLALGGEVGGSGAFVENDSGGRSIDTTFSAAIPVLVRLTRFSRVLDFELAPVFRFNPDEDALPPGGRAAMGVGLTTLRASAFMPYAVLWLGYEFHPENDTGPADHSIHAGTRVGVDWDP
jgi:hypothetical protein